MSHENIFPDSLPNSLWASSAHPAPDTSSLETSEQSEVVVIGGGFTGFSAALHLAQAGKQVTLLEANDIGYGGSGRNVGLVNAGLWTKPDDIESALGKTGGRKLYDALSKAPDIVYSLIERHAMSCEAERNGTLHLAHSGLGLKDLQDRTRQLQSRGAPVELLDAARTEELTGTVGHWGAILDPRAGTINPLGYARGLAQAAIDAGAKVFTRSPVTALTRQEGQHEWRVTTPNGSITAQQVVLATNAYSTNLWKDIPETYVPLYFSQFATAPLPVEIISQILPGKQGCWDTRQVMTSLRVDQQGRIILGSVGKAAELGHGMLEAWATSCINKLFPQLAGDILATREGASPWEFSWSGKIAYSDDHLPHLHILAPNLITCLGYSGRGIGPGTVMGKEIAEYILGKPIEELPLPLTQPTRIFGRGIREQYYTRGSDMYHLWQRIV